MPHQQIALTLLHSAARHQKHAVALARATGQHFNVFHILKVGRYEVKTHSPLLGDLLSPTGSHGQGAVFLQCFLNRLGITDFQAKGATVTLEKYIGQVTEDSGGRIDLFLRDLRGNCIIIENKIDARDQDKQLIRYRNHAPNAHLFYLTLERGLPHGMTEEEATELRCQPISYAQHILEWLRDCRKEAACVPVVRELLTHYIHLIETLTHQTPPSQMNEELVSQITSSQDSLNAFFHLKKLETSVQDNLLRSLFANLDRIATSLQMTLKGDWENLRNKDAGFYFTSDDITKEGLHIGFAFEKDGFRNLFFGFGRLNDQQASTRETRIKELFRGKSESSDWWPAWAWFEDPYRNWGDEAFEGLRSGDFANGVEARLKELLEIFNLAVEEASKASSHDPSHS
jgi:hypothetical protein